MHNFSQRRKLAWAVGLAVHHLLSTRRGLATFATFTFRENLTDKKEAAQCWRKLKERLRRSDKDLRGVGVWQRQKRGAWHLHYVFDTYMDIHWLRPVAVECGFGPMLNLRICEDIAAPQNKTWSRCRVVNYMTRYITRDMQIDPCLQGDQHPDGDQHLSNKNVRIVDYMMRRVATTAFSWAGGMSFVWRVGRQTWSDLFGGTPHFSEREFVLRLGMEALGEEGRARILESSDAVAAWWNPDAFPF